MPPRLMDEIAVFKIGIVGLPRDRRKISVQLSGGSATVRLRGPSRLDPEIVFLDEPTGGLIMRRRFRRLDSRLRQVWPHGIHGNPRLDTLFSICDRVAVLVDKKIRVALEEMLQTIIRGFNPIPGPPGAAVLLSEGGIDKNPRRRHLGV